MRTRLLSLCDVQMYRSHLKEALHYQYPDHYGIVVKHLLRGLSHYSVLSVHLTVTNVVCWWSLLSQLIECHVSCCMSNNVEFCLSASHSCYAHLSSSQPSDKPFRAQWRATTPVFLTAQWRATTPVFLTAQWRAIQSPVTSHHTCLPHGASVHTCLADSAPGHHTDWPLCTAVVLLKGCASGKLSVGVWQDLLECVGAVASDETHTLADDHLQASHVQSLSSSQVNWMLRCDWLSLSQVWIAR